MQVTCQFSLYPLGDVDLGGELDKAVSAIAATGLSPTIGNMSTYLEGEAGEVFSALASAFAVVAQNRRVVLTATLSNACPARERG